MDGRAKLRLQHKKPYRRAGLVSFISPKGRTESWEGWGGTQQVGDIAPPPALNVFVSPSFHLPLEYDINWLNISISIAFIIFFSAVFSDQNMYFFIYAWLLQFYLNKSFFLFLTIICVIS